MSSRLRGFWKDSEAGRMRADREAAAYNISGKKRKSGRRKKSKAPKVSKPIHASSGDSESFYRTMKWRQLRYLVLRNTEGRCQCCGGSAKDGLTMHVDHIRSRSTHPHLSLCLDNLQVLCEDCNIGKGSWDSTDWKSKME